MRPLSFIGLALIALAGCDPNKPVPLDNRPLSTDDLPLPVDDRPVLSEQTPPAMVEVGGPRGGIQVNDPAGGTQVDIGGGNGVHVKTPDSNVNVPSSNGHQ
ncbi:MAG TPA: hypothetical protein VHY91_05270 [Pirellulales bacterium]|nr:hypothetical protein [Pirellulales bacterium]